MAYVPPLNGGRINATISGNTAGAGTLISTGNMVLAGGNNVTLSQNGNSITISGANAPSGSINFSAGTTSNNLASVTFANSNNVSFGLNGSTLTGSVATSLTNVNLSAGTTSNNLSNMVFSNSNGVSFGLNGSTMTGSVAAQSAQTVGWYASGANTIGQSSSSTMDARSLNISGQGALSAGLSGSTLQLSAPGTSSLSASGAVSIATNGSTISIGAPAFSAGVSNLSNDSGNTGMVTNRLVLAGGNNIILSQSTNASGATVSISGSAGVALANSQTTYTSGTANFLEGGGAITIASTTGQKFNFSVPATSSLSVTGALSLSVNGSTVSLGAPAFSIGISSTIGNTAGTTGTVSNQLVLAGGNNITLSQSTGVGGNTITISGPNTAAQSAQTVGWYASGANTIGQSSSSTMDARSLNISGQGALSAGLSGSTLQLSAPAVSSVNAAGIVNISSNGSSVTISAPAFSAGMSTSTAGGVTGGTSGTVSNQFALAAGSNITLSQSTNTNGATVSIYGATNVLTSQSNQALSASNGAFTFQTAGFSNANGVTFGTSAGSIMTASVAAQSSISATGGLNVSSNGSTVSIGAPMLQQYIHNSAAMYSSATAAMVNGSASIVRMFIPNAISFTRAELPIWVTMTTAGNNNTAAAVISRTGIIYTRSGSTLNPIIGVTTNAMYSFSSDDTGAVNGPRLISFPLATTLAPGEYYLAIQLSSTATSSGGATTNLNWMVAPVFGTYLSASSQWAYLGDATALTNNAFQPMQGILSSTIANTSQTLQQSIISAGGSYGPRGNLMMLFKNDYFGE